MGESYGHCLGRLRRLERLYFVIRDVDWCRVVDNEASADLRRVGAEGGNLADVLLALGVPRIVRGLHAYPNSRAIAE
jgi:hypothetical protein